LPLRRLFNPLLAFVFVLGLCLVTPGCGSDSGDQVPAPTADQKAQSDAQNKAMAEFQQSKNADKKKHR